jgi:hypothetical protein
VHSDRTGEDVIAVTVQPEEFSFHFTIQGNSKVSYFTPYMVRRKKSRKMTQTR